MLGFKNICSKTRLDLGRTAFRIVPVENSQKLAIKTLHLIEDSFQDTQKCYANASGVNKPTTEPSQLEIKTLRLSEKNISDVMRFGFGE